MSARTILNPPLINELNDLFNGAGTSELSCSSLNINNTAGVLQSTLAEVGNGVATLINKDTASTYPTTVLQLVNATTQSCDLGVSSAGDFEVGLSGEVAISCGGLLLNDTSGVLQSTFGNVGNGVLTIQNSDPASTFPDVVVELRTNTNVTCNLGVGGTDVLSVGTTNGSGTVVAASYTGGIGCVIYPITIPGLSSTHSVAITITNFIGSDNSVYVASLSNSSISPINSTVEASYSGVSGSDTIVTVVVAQTNGGTSAGFTADVNIIAMNRP